MPLGKISRDKENQKKAKISKIIRGTISVKLLNLANDSKCIVDNTRIKNEIRILHICNGNYITLLKGLKFFQEYRNIFLIFNFN